MRSNLACLVVLAFSLTAPSFAAEDGRGDVFGSVGVSTQRGSRAVSHLIAGSGGSVLLAGGKVALFGEFGYMPLGSEVTSWTLSGPYSRVTEMSKQILLGGGLRLYISPLTRHFWLNKSLHHVTPYVPVGGGYARWTGSAVAMSGSPFDRNPENLGYFAAGLGVEIGSRRFGIRPEFRYITSSGGYYANGYTTFGASFYLGF